MLLWHVGEAKGPNPIQKEAVALLLPAAIAYLQQHSKPAVPAVHAACAQQSPQDAPSAAGSASMAAAMSAARQAGAGSSGDNKAGIASPDAVRGFFAAQLTQYMTAKIKLSQGKVLELVDVYTCVCIY